MKILNKAIFFVVCGAFSWCAMGTEDYNKTLAVAGVQGGVGYFKVQEATSVNCKYETFYIGSLSDAFNRSVYATVLSAQASGKKITRLGYTLGSDGSCLVNLLEVGG